MTDVIIISTDGDNCTVNAAALQSALNERKQYFEDIHASIGHVKKMLIELGLMTQEGKMKDVSAGKLVTLAMNANGLASKFEHLKTVVAEMAAKYGD